MPDTLFFDCPDCDDYTEHQILKGRMGKASIDGTFKCLGCGRVSSENIKIPALLEVPVVFSDGDVSEVTKTTIESNDIIALEDEFFMDDGRHFRLFSMHLNYQLQLHHVLQKLVRIL